MSDGKNASMNGAPHEKKVEALSGEEHRRVMLTQILRSPVFNPEGDRLGQVEDVIVKLGDTGYPPITGLKVRIGGRDLYVGGKLIEKLAPDEVRLSTHSLHLGSFERRPGEVLLAADVLGRHLMDVNAGRIVRAHNLVLGATGGVWHLLGVDRSPRAIFHRFVRRPRHRSDLRKHAILDWKDVQPFVHHVPTAKLLVPLQRLRRLHPAQIADLVEGASHEEGEEIIHAVESDVELTADVFEELDPQHRREFLNGRSNEEAAKVLDRMAPDDAADLLGELEQDRRLPVLNLMSPHQQHKIRKLLQHHPATAGGLMNPDYVSVNRGTTVAEALDRIRKEDKAPHQLLGTVFVTDPEGRFVGSLTAIDLLRAAPDQAVEEVSGLVGTQVGAGADIADVTLLMADYNLTAVAVTDAARNLIGAISVDDLMKVIVPEDWRDRVEASTGV